MSRFDDRYLNFGDVYDIIMQAKTVDQAMNVLHLPYVEMPRRNKSKWVKRYLNSIAIVYECNNCGWAEMNTSNFCPNCGSEMDEVTE